jgi:hypothetical protein
MAFGRTPGLAKTAAQANYKHLLLGLVIAILQWNKPALDRSIEFVGNLKNVLCAPVAALCTGLPSPQSARAQVSPKLGRPSVRRNTRRARFAAIRMLPDSQAKGASFQLVFRRQPEARRFWKDLVVNILQEIETTPQKASIDLDSKGEREPVSNSSMG